jgi:hypothetical protein
MSESMERKCGTTESSKNFLKDPTVRARRMAIEKSTLAKSLVPSSPRPIVTIPVVFHIVYNTPEQNIPDSQIASQIKVLNLDFRMLNADIVKIPEIFKHLATDARIEFKLAKRDPQGNLTTGITRTRTDKTVFSHIIDDVKFEDQGGKNPWDTRKYLNIWVCNITENILGYATPPGMAPENEDGVVLHTMCTGTEGNLFPDYNKGRTATHEVGHYLDLYHIWGPEDPEFGNCSGSDNVADTPNQFTANFRNPPFPKISCNNGPHGDMFMNYMDYVFDESMFMFTHGQVQRMDAAISGPRSSLQVSDALIEPMTFESSNSITRLTENEGSKMIFNGVEYVEPSKIFVL